MQPGPSAGHSSAAVPHVPPPSLPPSPPTPLLPLPYFHKLPPFVCASKYSNTRRLTRRASSWFLGARGRGPACQRPSVSERAQGAFRKHACSLSAQEEAAAACGAMTNSHRWKNSQGPPGETTWCCRDDWNPVESNGNVRPYLLQLFQTSC